MNEEFTQSQEYILQGRALLSADQYPQAQAAFEKAIAADQMVPEGYFGLGEVYVMMDEFQKAKDTFSKVLLIDKQNGEAYFHLGNVELLLRHVEEGKIQFAKALNCGYDNPQIYVNLAATAEEANDYTQAMVYYNKAIARDKLCVDAKLRKVELHMMMGNKKEALQAADSLIETNPEIFEGHHYKFTLLADLGQKRAAAEAIAFARKLFPDDQGFLFDQVRALELEEQYEKALALLEEHFEDGPNALPSVQQERARLLTVLERIPQAVSVLERSLAGTMDGGSVYMLNMLYLSQQQFQKAVDVSQALMDTEGRDMYYYSAVYFHALALKKLGDAPAATKAFGAAAKLFRMACATNPDLLDLYIYRAICHKELGDYDKALELCDYITTLAPQVAEGYLIRSEVYGALNDPEKAQEQRKLALSKNPKLAGLLS